MGLFLKKPPPAVREPATGGVYVGPVGFCDGVHYPAVNGRDCDLSRPLIWVDHGGFPERVRLATGERHGKPTLAAHPPLNMIADDVDRQAHDDAPAEGHYEFWDGVTGGSHFDRYHRFGIDVDPELPGEELP